MSFVLDTQVPLWAAGVPERWPDEARALMEDLGTELVFSARRFG